MRQIYIQALQGGVKPQTTKYWKLREEAQKKLKPEAFDYVDGSASTQTTERNNRSALDGFLSRNGQQAAAFGFPGTPAFIIGTVLYPGGMDKPALLNAVRTARA